MNEKQIGKIITERKLTPDNLDDKWGKIWGYFPALCLILAFGIPLLPFIDNKMTWNPMINWIGLLIGILLFILTYYWFITERNLNQILTNLPLKLNKEILSKALLKLNTDEQINKNYIVGYLPTLFKQKSHKIIVIATDNMIYFNIRCMANDPIMNVRLPYSLGIQSFYELKFKRKIKDYVQQHI